MQNNELLKYIVICGTDFHMLEQNFKIEKNSYMESCEAMTSSTHYFAYINFDVLRNYLNVILLSVWPTECTCLSKDCLFIVLSIILRVGKDKQFTSLKKLQGKLVLRSFGSGNFVCYIILLYQLVNKQYKTKEMIVTALHHTYPLSFYMVFVPPSLNSHR